MKIETKNGIFTTEIEEVENKYVKCMINSIIERNKGYEVINMTVKDDDPEFEPTDEEFCTIAWELILYNGNDIRLYSSDLEEPEYFTDTDDETFCLDFDYLTSNVFTEKGIKEIFAALKNLYFLTYGEELDSTYDGLEEHALSILNKYK